MSIYAGLNVSDKTTHICVVDVDGRSVRRDVVASDPDVLAKWLNRHYPDLARVVLETGKRSTFKYRGLIERGVKVECICARQAKGALLRGSTKATSTMQNGSRSWHEQAGINASI